MEKGFITLSTRELERIRIISKVMDRSMRQMEASVILGISDRQIRNLIVKIREKGDKGITHGNRGREAPNKMPKAQKVEVREQFDGKITVKFKDRYLDCHEVFEVKPKREEKKVEPGQPHKRYK